MSEHKRGQCSNSSTKARHLEQKGGQQETRLDKHYGVRYGCFDAYRQSLFNKDPLVILISR